MWTRATNLDDLCTYKAITWWLTSHYFPQCHVKFIFYYEWRGEEQGSKSPFSLLSEPISLSSLLLIPSSRSIQFNSPCSQLFFFSLLPTFLFLPPPYLFPLFLSPPNFFWAISPSSLFCSSPLWMQFCSLRVNNITANILDGVQSLPPSLTQPMISAMTFVEQQR